MADSDSGATVNIVPAVPIPAEGGQGAEASSGGGAKNAKEIYTTVAEGKSIESIQQALPKNRAAVLAIFLPFGFGFKTPPQSVGNTVGFSFNPESWIDGSVAVNSMGEGAIRQSMSWDLHVAIEGSAIFKYLGEKFIYAFQMETTKEDMVIPPQIVGESGVPKWVESAQVDFSGPYLLIDGALFPSKASVSVSTVEYPFRKELLSSTGAGS